MLGPFPRDIWMIIGKYVSRDKQDLLAFTGVCKTMMRWAEKCILFGRSPRNIVPAFGITERQFCMFKEHYDCLEHFDQYIDFDDDVVDASDVARMLNVFIEAHPKCLRYFFAQAEPVYVVACTKNNGIKFCRRIFTDHVFFTACTALHFLLYVVCPNLLGHRRKTHKRRRKVK